MNTQLEEEFDIVSDEMLAAIISINNPLAGKGSILEILIREGMIMSDNDGQPIPLHLVAKEISQLHMPKKSLYPTWK